MPEKVCLQHQLQMPVLSLQINRHIAISLWYDQVGVLGTESGVNRTKAEGGNRIVMINRLGNGGKCIGREGSGGEGKIDPNCHRLGPSRRCRPVGHHSQAATKALVRWLTALRLRRRLRAVGGYPPVRRELTVRRTGIASAAVVRAERPPGSLVDQRIGQLKIAVFSCFGVPFSY